MLLVVIFWGLCIVLYSCFCLFSLELLFIACMVQMYTEAQKGKGTHLESLSMELLEPRAPSIQLVGHSVSNPAPPPSSSHRARGWATPWAVLLRPASRGSSGGRRNVGSRLLLTPAARAFLVRVPSAFLGAGGLLSERPRTKRKVGAAQRAGLGTEWVQVGQGGRRFAGRAAEAQRLYSLQSRAPTTKSGYRL